VIDDLKKDAEQRMQKAVDSVTKAFKRIRTGRAHPSILDEVKVDYYGQMTPLAAGGQRRRRGCAYADCLALGKGMVPKIEKAIMTSDLGLNPATSGDVIRLPMPALTEDSRKGIRPPCP